MRYLQVCLGLLVVWLACPEPRNSSAALAQEVTVAAASDLHFAIKDIVAKFEAEKGVKVKLTLGSSGNFFAQITNGAPFDVYFSADIGYPKKLEELGLTMPGSLHRYAIGRIVIWVPTASTLDVSQGAEVLRQPDIKKISIANPKHAPYGRAAVAAMNHYKVEQAVRDKLVMAENVSQAAQFVESGAADLGIIALSLALSPTMKQAGRFWKVPAEAHPALDQGVVILQRSKHPEAARMFLEFVKGPVGREIMARYGFILPE